VQIVRRYRVKVHSFGIGSDGKPYGDSYSYPVPVSTDRIAEAVNDTIGSVVSAGESVHSVIVEPVSEFIP
jgi:hypothetical protein